MLDDVPEPIRPVAVTTSVPPVSASATVVVPAIIADAGDRATRRFLEFFAATIGNENTRVAYLRAVTRFFVWCDHHKPGQLADVESKHVAAYIKALGKHVQKPTVKQHLAAIRTLYDWLVAGHVVATNPARAVPSPKYVANNGKTTILDAGQAREFLDSIETTGVVGLRDRALIGVMTFAFARIGAVVTMRVEDYYPTGKRWWVRLHEKGGKRHELPAPHGLQVCLNSYIEAAGLAMMVRPPSSARQPAVPAH